MTAFKENAAQGLLFFCAMASALTVLAIFVFMLALGLPLFAHGGFWEIWTNPWAPLQGLYGLTPMIAGTLWLALSATLMAFPLSLGTSFVIAGLGGRRLRALLTSAVRFMTGIPTVIYGFAGIFLLVPLVREYFGGPGMSVLTAAVVLAVLISPTMILFFSDSLLAVNPGQVKAARALGADRIQCLLYVMTPQALGGMTSGVILGLGRALGDTLIALMLAGNAVGIPGGFLDPARTLTAHVALVKAADYDSLEFRSIFACGIALYLLTTCAVLAVRRIGRGQGNRMDREMSS
jgi:phosphate transport system permease protein